MADLKYFNTTKKGEMFELRAELNSDKKERKKDAVKKIIASMTIGKDVSSLFPDVINCMQTDNLELKKLVYLYLMSYAKTQPDLAILAVNTFVKDCEDSNPLIRALAIRTMGCIRVEKISEYLCTPLRQGLKDEDPYVRKTSAMCVAKLHDINPTLVEEQGFLPSLRNLINDSNPMVVSNAVAALTEISSSSSVDVFKLDSAIANKLLTALNECSEWGQVYLLDAIATYKPKDQREAQSICERVTSRLAHANSAVVLSTVKVLMLLMDRMDENCEFVKILERKLAPPLVTLLSAEPEIQYVALRNISIIIQKRPSILSNELRVFFVKYNDPIYVKLEKLDIMIRLVNVSNINQVLSELKEYATEVDVEFVCKAVRAIGRCAIKVELAAERCVSTLLDLIKTRVSYVVQESVIVIKDIFRRYPNRFEAIIETLCENLDSLDEPEARSSMIWIVGQYAERIENAIELLTGFVDSFAEESNANVQLQLLTAVVKAFLKRPKEAQHLITRILQLAAEESDNPDVRDRAYIYWRLLSTDSKAARDIVLSDKPTINEETDSLEPVLLTQLVSYIGSLVSVFQKPPREFLDSKNAPIAASASGSSQGHATCIGDEGKKQMPSRNGVATLNLLDMDSFGEEGEKDDRMPSNDMLGTISYGDLKIDADLESILGLPSVSPAQQSSPHTDVVEDSATDGIQDILNLLSLNEPSPVNEAIGIAMTSSPGNDARPKVEWLSADAGSGLSILGRFVYDTRGGISMQMTFHNTLPADEMTGFAMQLNRNPFRISFESVLCIGSLASGHSVDVEQRLIRAGKANLNPCPLGQLQVAVKNNFAVFYFVVTIPLVPLLVPDKSPLLKAAYNAEWTKLGSANQLTADIVNSPWTAKSASDLSVFLERSNVFTVYEDSRGEKGVVLHQALRLAIPDDQIYGLIDLRMGSGHIEVEVRANHAELPAMIVDMYEDLIGRRP